MSAPYRLQAPHPDHPAFVRATPTLEATALSRRDRNLVCPLRCDVGHRCPSECLCASAHTPSSTPCCGTSACTRGGLSWMLQGRPPWRCSCPGIVRPPALPRCAASATSTPPRPEAGTPAPLHQTPARASPHESPVCTAAAGGRPPTMLAAGWVLSDLRKGRVFPLSTCDPTGAASVGGLDDAGEATLPPQSTTFSAD